MTLPKKKKYSRGSPPKTLKDFNLSVFLNLIDMKNGATKKAKIITSPA